MHAVDLGVYRQHDAYTRLPTILLMTACRKGRRGSTKRRGVRSLEANQVLQPEQHHLTET